MVTSTRSSTRIDSDKKKTPPPTRKPEQKPATSAAKKPPSYARQETDTPDMKPPAKQTPTPDLTQPQALAADIEPINLNNEQQFGEPYDFAANWSDEESSNPWQDEGAINIPFNINQTFLTATFPTGLNMSALCINWMKQLGIYTWKDLQDISTEHTVKTLMQALSISDYHQSKTDMRILLTIGKICKKFPDRLIDPDTSNFWIPDLLCTLYIS